MGGLYPKMKITALTMLVGVLAIAGIPLFSGWYSKDAILAQALGFVDVHPQHFLLFLLPLVTAGITTFYMFRMWFMTFTGEPRDHHVHEHAHESPWLMTVPLIVLAFFSVVVAWGWPIWDAEASCLEHHLHHSQHHAVMADFGHCSAGRRASWRMRQAPARTHATERTAAHEYHDLAGNLALVVGRPRHRVRRRWSTTTACSTRPRRRSSSRACTASWAQVVLRRAVQRHAGAAGAGGGAAGAGAFDTTCHRRLRRLARPGATVTRVEVGRPVRPGHHRRPGEPDGAA